VVPRRCAEPALAKFRIAATERVPVPDILTVDEAGLAQLHISVWAGCSHPKGRPKA
jgi:hypothetical protein